MRNKFIYILLGLLIINIPLYSQSLQNNKPRTIITTDGEVDDIDSFIRFLLYANEVKLEGLVYSSSQWHYSGDGKGTLFTSEMPSTARRYGERTDLRWAGTNWIQELIKDYGSIYDNLTKHAEGYPTPDYLLSLVKVGNIEFEGEMEKNTEGSDFIKDILLDENPNPVYLQIWGGTNTVARALKSIEEEYKSTPEWPAIYKKVTDKSIIYAVLDQDAAYKKYVEPNWPDIKVYYNSAQFWSFAYSWTRVVPEELKHYLEGPWFAENILFNHGPLLAKYYTWGDGQQIVGDDEHTQGDMDRAIRAGRKQYDFISEGDSPAYFQLIDVGLRNINDPSYGGWGGRMVQSKENPNRWEDGKDVVDYNPYIDSLDDAYPQTRWIDVLQNDFAARADWAVMSYKDANHAPVVKLKHAEDLIVSAGSKVKLRGSAKDPDGDTLSYHWWQYEEAGSYRGKVEVQNADKSKAAFVVPENAESGQTIHIILEVKDSGTPQLTRYQRVIVTVK